MSRVLREESERYDLLSDSSLGSPLLAFSVRLYSGALAGSGAKWKAEQKALNRFGDWRRQRGRVVRALDLQF